MSGANQNLLWKNDAFRGLFLSTIFFTFGFTIYGLCLPLIVYDLTKSAETMGIVRGVEFLPNLFFAILVGIFFDRVDRKKWSIRLLIALSILILGLYLACRWMINPLPVVIVGTFITMLICYAYFNASFGLQKISLSHEHQQASMSLFSSVRTFFDTLGPALTGIVFLFSSPKDILIVLAGVFLCCAIFLRRIPYSHQPIQKKSYAADLIDGWRSFLTNKGLVHISLFVIVINTCVSVFEIQSIFIVKDILKFSSSQVGFMMSMLGCGGFLGTFLVGRCRKKFGLGNSLYILTVATSLSILAPMLSLTAGSFYVGFFLLGLASLMFNIMVWSYRQETTEPIFMGRIAGITGSIFKLGMPLALSLSGYILTAFGFQNLLLACVLPLLGALVVFYRFSMIRELI